MNSQVPPQNPHNSFQVIDIPDGTEACIICYNEYSITEFQIPLPCGDKFCKSCVTAYLEERINSFHVINIKCPNDNCTYTFTEQVIQQTISPDLYRRYKERVLTKLMNKDLSVKFCPAPGCSRPFKPKNDAPYTVCKCGTKICNICCNPWHEGKTCLQAIDPSFELYTKENNVKFCVMCKTVVTRVGGCKKMTCPICDFQWCWDCGREFDTAHELTCPRHWSPKPPSDIEDKERKIGVKDIFKAIILIPKFLLLTLWFTLAAIFMYLLWPLFQFYNPQRDLSLKRPFRSLYVILVSIIIGVPTALLMLAVSFFPIIVLIILFPALTLLILGICFGTMFFVYAISFCCLEMSNRRQKKKQRWYRGNPEQFKYTSVARPGPEGANNDHPPAADQDQRNEQVNPEPPQIVIQDGAQDKVTNIEMKEIDSKQVEVQSQSQTV